MNTALLCILFSIAIIVPFADCGAYCTYHLYNAGDSLGTVACSDGANGIMTKFGYSNLAPMYPYVTAYSGASWNSPQCGRCVEVRGTHATVYLTVIDYCGPPTAGNDAHFDIAPPAFEQLFGGLAAGWKDQIGWSFVESHRCQGNKGNTGGSPPPPVVNNPPPPPPPQGGSSTQRCGNDWTAANNGCGRQCNHDGDCAGQGFCYRDLKACGGSPPPVVSNPPPAQNSGSTTRCGRDWSDANNKCGNSCQNDGACGGEKCFADLSKAPCGNKATEDDVTSFSTEENFVTEETFVDAAVADTTEEEYVDNFVDNYVDTAIADTFDENFVDSAIADNFADNFDANFDAAVAADPSLNTQPQQTQNEASTGMQGWMVAILVMFSITTVLLLAVIILAVFVMRKH